MSKATSKSTVKRYGVFIAGPSRFRSKVLPDTYRTAKAAQAAIGMASGLSRFILYVVRPLKDGQR